MKVEIKEQPQQFERKYPYVGRYNDNGNIFHVLFFKERTGVTLDCCHWGVNHFSELWSEKSFTPLPPNSVTITI